MAKLRHNARYSLSEHNCASPEEARELIIELLRSGEISAETGNAIADMLDTKSDTYYKMSVIRRRAGKPQDKIDWDVFTDIVSCRRWLEKKNIKVSARSILDNAHSVGGLRRDNFSELSEKTINKHLRFLRETDAIELGEVDA
jgi:hypothetical protein